MWRKQLFFYSPSCRRIAITCVSYSSTQWSETVLNTGSLLADSKLTAMERRAALVKSRSLGFSGGSMLACVSLFYCGMLQWLRVMVPPSFCFPDGCPSLFIYCFYSSAPWVWAPQSTHLHLCLLTDGGIMLLTVIGEYYIFINTGLASKTTISIDLQLTEASYTVAKRLLTVLAHRTA